MFRFVTPIPPFSPFTEGRRQTRQKLEQFQTDSRNRRHLTTVDYSAGSPLLVSSTQPIQRGKERIVRPRRRLPALPAAPPHFPNFTLFHSHLHLHLPPVSLFPSLSQSPGLLSCCLAVNPLLTLPPSLHTTTLPPSHLSRAH